MTINKSNRRDVNAKAEPPRSVVIQSSPSPERVSIDVQRSGEWMPVEDLRAAALVDMAAGNDVTVNVDRIDHLDASSLQILLAFDVEQKKRGRSVELANISSNLRHWFEYAGAAERFSMTELKRDE